MRLDQMRILRASHNQVCRANLLQGPWVSVQKFLHARPSSVGRAVRSELRDLGFTSKEKQ